MFLLFIIVVGLWDLVTRMGWVSPIILPTPMETLNDLIFVGSNLTSGGYMLSALWTTTLTVFYGFLIAVCIGFSLGVLVGETKFGERAVMPYLVAIDTMPRLHLRLSLLHGSVLILLRRLHLLRLLQHFPLLFTTAAGLYAATENERMLFKSNRSHKEHKTLLHLKLPTEIYLIFLLD